jgi:hypothetical protein
MRPIGLGLLAALIVAFTAPGVAMAAAPAKPPPIDAAKRKQGMADAPALVQSAGIGCQVSDAYLAGKTPPDKKTGSLGASIYEVACGPGAVGFLIQTNGTSPPAVFSCVNQNYPPDMPAVAPHPCVLPDNLDLKTALTAIANKGKVPCAPDKFRGVGQTSTSTLYEALCPTGVGYIVIASSSLDPAKDVTSNNCLFFDAADSPNKQIKCVLNTPEVRQAAADKVAQMANAGCTVKDRRYIGVLTDGTEGYEFACSDGKGFIAKVNAQGAIAQTLDCAKLAGGGCTLTDTRAALAEQAGLYTRLAKESGSNCQVQKYAVFPARGSEEVVELVCENGAGAIGMFPATGKGRVLDCGHSLVAGYKCSLGKPDYSALTADLNRFDKKECQVSSVGLPKKAPDGTISLEVACSDGLPGYVIQFADPQTAKNVTGCAFAGSCELPTNKKKG